MLKSRKNVRKIKNIVTIIITLIMILGIYIKVEAIDSGPGTINPIYKPEWEKVSSTIDTANQSISIVLKGTAVESQTINDDVSINYSSTVSSSLETSDILVYIDGELDGDTNKNGVLDVGETPSITKAITPVAPIEGVSAVTQTVTLSGFGETLRQDGKPYKEWSGNIKLKIKGRGKDASTYSEDVLIDVYGNQNMMETDQDGTNADGSWKDIVFGDANSTTNTNTSGVMFTDFIKPEFTYVHSAQTTNINNETETVTVVFDVIDKYFNTTTLSNLDASQITIHFDDYDVTELNNILDTNNHKQLTKKTIAEDETTANGVTYKTDGSIWYTVNGTSKKIGERYQLVVTGLDQEDAFKYSGYMTLAFDAGAITDQAGNTSEATSITVGKNEPGGSTGDEIVVDVVDPIWVVENQNVTTTSGITSVTMDLIATDKFHKINPTTEEALTALKNQIQIRVGGTDISAIATELEKGLTYVGLVKKDASGNYVSTTIETEAIGQKYTLSITNLEETYETFIQEFNKYQAGTGGRPYREFSGPTQIYIPADIIEDKYGNKNNEKTVDLGIIDTLKPEIIKLSAVNNPSAKTQTITFTATDKYFKTSNLLTVDEITVKVNGDTATSVAKPTTVEGQTANKNSIWKEMTSVPITATVDGRPDTTVGYTYTLVLSNFEQAEKQTGKSFIEWSGDISIEIAQDAVEDTNGIGNATKELEKTFADFILPKIEIVSATNNTSTKTQTIVFTATDKYFDTTDELAPGEITVKVNGETASSISKALTSSPIKETVNGVPNTIVGYTYTLVLSSFEQTEKQTGKSFIEWSGNISIEVIAGAVNDKGPNGNGTTPNENVLTPLNGTFADFIQPKLETVDTTKGTDTETIVFTITDKYLNTTDPLQDTEITVLVDGETAGDITKDLTSVPIQETVEGTPNTIVGYTYTLVLSDFEKARNAKNYQDWSGTVSIVINEDAVKDTSSNTLATEVTARTVTGDFVDFIAPDVKYTHQSTDVQTGTKKYVMTFDVTDKYYNSGVLTTDDILNGNIEILMQNGQYEREQDANGDWQYKLDGNGKKIPIVYNLKDEPVTWTLSATPITKSFNKTVSGAVVTGGEYTIGHTYTLTISNLEKLDIKTGLTTADYSGVITVSIDDSKILDTTTNGNPATTLTSGMNFSGETSSGTAVEVDVVDPIWEKVSSSALAKTPTDEVNTSATTGTASLTIRGTDTYLDATDSANDYDDSTLTSDEIEVYIDGVKTTALTPVISTVTTLTETRKVFDSDTTEDVQYGVEYTITLDGWIQGANQVKIKILKDAIKDESGNGNKATDFIIYNMLKSAASESSETSVFLGGTIPRQDIHEIIFTDSLSGATGTIWDVSATQDGSIKAWTSQESAPYTVYIGSDYEIFANRDSTRLFRYIGYSEACTETETIKGISLLNTSSVVSMYGMFSHCGYRAMTSLNLGNNFDTSNVTNMKYMFDYTGYNAMTSMNLGGKFDTSNVTDMSYMFRYCGYTKLGALDLGGKFNTSKVTNMSYMFTKCGRGTTDEDGNILTTGITSLNLGTKFDTSNVTDMSYMFAETGHTALTSLDLSSGTTTENTTQFNTSSVTNMKYMFNSTGNKAMTSINLGNNFDTSNVTNMEYMFRGCGRNAMTSLNLGGKFDTSEVTTMAYMFSDCGKNSMESLNLGDKFDTSKVTQMQDMFNFCGEVKMTSLDLGDKFYTTSVTRMDKMFYRCGKDNMTILDLGPAFTKIATTNTDMFSYTGKSGACTIYAPEAIYKNKNAFKLSNTDTTETADALKYTRGTINPIYKPEWTKESSSITGETISIVLKGTASKTQEIDANVKINYASNVTSNLTAEDITVYINGQEAPWITKTLPAASPATGASVTQTLTLSNFEETTRQLGIPFKEWSGNIKIRIGGRGEATSTYTANTLVENIDRNADGVADTNVNQSMMATDETGTWIDVTYQDADSTTNTNTSGTMFTDFIKPEFTYVYSEETTTIDHETETVTVVFDVVDKYFESTTLSNLDASQITIHFDDYDVTELNNILDTNNHKQLTKKTIAEDETTADGRTYKTDGSIWYTVNGTSKKIGERYQLVVTGLDQGDAFEYSGYMTLAFAAGTITDQQGNTSDATSITVGKNEPGGSTGDGIIVDVVDPIWELVESSTDSGVIKIRGKDKYFKESTLDEDGIIVYTNGVASETIGKELSDPKYYYLDESGNYVETNDIAQAIAIEYTLQLSNVTVENPGYVEFTPKNADELVGDTAKYREENGGSVKIEVVAGTLEDDSGNLNNKAEFDIGIMDATSPEVYDIDKIHNKSAGTDTIIFNVTDRNYNPEEFVTTNEIEVYIDGELIEGLIADETALTSKPIKVDIDGKQDVILGHQYTLVLSNLVELYSDWVSSGRDYRELSGTVEVKIATTAAEDNNGNNLNPNSTTITDFVDFVDPEITYTYFGTTRDETPTASPDIDYGNKTFKMVFEVTDKYFAESTLTSENIRSTLLAFLDEDAIINNTDIDISVSAVEDINLTGSIKKTVDGQVKTVENPLIGKRYTILFENLEQLIIAEGNTTADYSGVISLTIPIGVFKDTSTNGNVSTTITSGVDIPGGTGTGVVVDVVDPIWDNVGNAQAYPSEGTAFITLEGTDKYYESSTLTSLLGTRQAADILTSIQVEVDGVVTTDGITIKVEQDEFEVDYGVKFTITVEGYSTDAEHVKLILKSGTLTDESENTNKDTGFVLFTSLMKTNTEQSETSGFLGSATAYANEIIDDNIQRQKIEKIIFADTYAGTEGKTWDVSAKQDNSIVAWYEKDATTGNYTIYIWSEFAIYGNVDSSYLFSYIGYASTCKVTGDATAEDDTQKQLIENIQTLNTDNVKNMSYMFQFLGYNTMKSFDLGTNFITNSVTDMSYMFYRTGYTALTSLDLSSGTNETNTTQFNTSSVINMTYMFYETGYSAMTSLNLGNNFNTGNVTDMGHMFRGCGYKEMTSLNLGGKFDTSEVTDMKYMFSGCGRYSMETLNLGDKFDTSKVTDMEYMFNMCGYEEMTSLDLGDKFYTTSVTNMDHMFYGCGQDNMTSLDLGPAFTKIASTNTGMFGYTGLSGACTIYAPESIYSSKNYFKLNTDATEGTVNYTRGTINPVYKPEWEKVSTTLDEENKEITVTFKGYANETFTNGTYTGDYESTITTYITGGNDPANRLIVKVDGEIAEDITQTITEVSITENEVQYTIKLSGFEQDQRQDDKNFLEWAGNIAIQPIKGTLEDIYGNKNMTLIDDAEGKWTDIEFRDTTQQGSTDKTVSGNWTDTLNQNTEEKMFTDYIKPEFTYEYYNSEVDTNANTVIDYQNNKVTVVFDVTDKYFNSSTLAADENPAVNAQNITVIVDNDEDADTAVSKTLAKKTLATDTVVGDITYKANGDIYYTINGVSKKIGERYELVITNLESEYGVGYSGIVTLAIPAEVVTDVTGNKSDATTITIGVDKPQNHPEHNTGAVVDVVNPIWSYATSDIDRTNKEVHVYILGSDKFYKENTLTTDKITVFVDESSTTVDTDRDGTPDANIVNIQKSLTEITDADELAELAEMVGLTDSIANNLTEAAIGYKLTLKNFGTISGQTKVVIDEETIEDTSGNKNTDTPINVGNVTWEETNEPLESGVVGYPRYPAFRNNIVDFIKPTINYTSLTVEGTQNPDIDYEHKIVTIKFTVTDKYLLESDLITADNKPKNIEIIVDNETVYDETTEKVTTSISSTDIANGKEYTLIVSDLEREPNDAFNISGPMQLVFAPNVIDDTSGNKNDTTTISLNTEYDDIVDVVDPLILVTAVDGLNVSSRNDANSIDRSNDTVKVLIRATDKYLDKDSCTLDVSEANVKVKVVKHDGTIIEESASIQNAITINRTSGQYIDYEIILSDFGTDQGLTSIIIPADVIKDTSGNGNLETEVYVGNTLTWIEPGDGAGEYTAFKNSIVDFTDPTWNFATSSITRDRAGQVGTVTVKLLGHDDYYLKDTLTKEIIDVYINGTKNTDIVKDLVKITDTTELTSLAAQAGLTDKVGTRTITDVVTGYTLTLSNFGTNDGITKIVLPIGSIKDTSGNGNIETEFLVGNDEWVETDVEPDVNNPKYTAFRDSIVDFIKPVISYQYVEDVNPVIDREHETIEIKFTSTDTNYFENNIDIGDIKIFVDNMQVYGTGSVEANRINASLSSTAISDGSANGYIHTLTLSQFELAEIIGEDIFKRHSGEIKLVIAKDQVTDTSGNMNNETTLIIDEDDGDAEGEGIIVDFVDPIIYYHSHEINWSERWAEITLRATDRFYNTETKLLPTDLTLYENINGQWIQVTDFNGKISIDPVSNGYGYDFVIKLKDFEEEFKMKVSIPANKMGDTSGNYNQFTEIPVNLDNKKPRWQYVSTDTSGFEPSTGGTISFNVKGEDKFLDLTNSELLNTDIKVLLDGVDITNTDNITVTPTGSGTDAVTGNVYESYKIDVTGLTTVGTYTLVLAEKTLIDEFLNESAATTISFSKSAIAPNTGNYKNITYHVSPDNNLVHHSFVHELMSVNISGTNFENKTFRPSSLGELYNNGENPLFAEPAGQSFAGWAEADEKGNVIYYTDATYETISNIKTNFCKLYGLYDEISIMEEDEIHLRAVWEEATVIYVSSTNGNNDNDGLTPSTPVADIQTANSKLSSSGTVGNNIIVVMDTVTWDSSTVLSNNATITSLYAGIDYNGQLIIDSNMETTADITFDNIGLYSENSEMLIANYANVILGRGVETPSGKFTFGTIVGGNYQPEEETTGQIGTHTVRVEAGRYVNIIAGSSVTEPTSTNKFVTHEVVIGNMRDTAISRNDKLTITGYVTIGENEQKCYPYGSTGATDAYNKPYSNVTLYSGTIGTTGSDFAINLRSVNGQTDGIAKLEMYGGQVNSNIYAGARTTARSADAKVNIMKFYGGTVSADVYGQSNNEAFTGSSEITLGGIIKITGNVFGGSNQGSGTGDSYITVTTDSAKVEQNIYGASNGSDLTGTTNITVNAGTLKNIYGSGNNGGNIGTTNITINNGSISGNIVGGAHNGQVTGSANITVVGGTISGSIFGGNENTTQAQLDSDTYEQNATIIIGTTDEEITTKPTINGNIYGGGTFDKVGTTNIQLIEAENATSVFGGANANSSTKNANITLNGMTVNSIYGGGQGAGTVETATINLISGTAGDVYGGGYAADVSTANILLQGTESENATVTNIFGGANSSVTSGGSVDTANVTLISGNVTNVFGGGNSSAVGTANVTVDGITIDEIYGGSKNAGVTETTNITLTSGSVGTVFGGGLDVGVGESNITHQGTTVVTSIFGGNDSTEEGNGGDTGTSNINIIDSTVVNVYGGNNLKGTTTNTNINIQGNSTITGELYGGGYKSAIGKADATGSTTINITGGTINNDINGGSKQGVVYGNTDINIGKDAVDEATAIAEDINIGGDIYGAGSSELQANKILPTSTEQYNYNFVSVVGDTHIMMDNSTESPITFGGSIFGAGNGAKYSNGTTTDNSTIHLKDFEHQLVSIERTGKLYIGSSNIELLGRQDINNAHRNTSYTLNRITDGVTVYSDTTIHTRRGFNMVGGFNSYKSIAGLGTLAKATVRDSVVVTDINVDNRLYTFEGINLIFSKEESPSPTSTNFGEVNGMTFFGMYALDDSGDKVYDIYDPEDVSGAIEDFFANGTYIEGLHEQSHNINNDGFYTNIPTYGDTVTVRQEVIQPTPANATYYDWIVGAETVTYNVSLIGSVYGDKSMAEVLLDHNYGPNTTYTLDRVSLNALNLGVELVDPLDIDMTSDDANNTFGLTMETGSSGWLSKAETNIYTQKDALDTTEENNGSFVGDKVYYGHNADTPGKIKFKLYNSINITEQKDLGNVNLILTGKTKTGEDASEGVPFIIVIAVNIQTEIPEQVLGYVPRFTQSVEKELHYTSDSRVDISYILYKEIDTSPYEDGDYRVLSTTTRLPEGTKLTLKDYSTGDSPKVYYYHITDTTPVIEETVDGEAIRFAYRLSNFFAMDSTTVKYQDSDTYYNNGLAFERYDLSIDFIDSGLEETSLLEQETYLELRSATETKLDNDETEVIYNLHHGQNADVSHTISNEGNSYSVVTTTNIPFTLDIEMEENTINGQTIQDTKYYDRITGIAIEIVEDDESEDRIKHPNVQNVTLTNVDDTNEHYEADESGVIRVPLLETISSISKNYELSMTQNSVPPGRYKVKVYLFTSDNGQYYGGETKLEKVFYATFVSKALGLVGIEATDDSRIISKETGLNLEGNTGVDMTIKIGDPVENTNVRVQLYKRNPTYVTTEGVTTYTGTSYQLVNINDYLEGTFETPETYGLTSSGANEYILWLPEDESEDEGVEPQAQEIVEIQLQKALEESVTTGEYKLVIKSYYDDILVQTERKTFMVTE